MRGAKRAGDETFIVLFSAETENDAASIGATLIREDGLTVKITAPVESIRSRMSFALNCVLLLVQELSVKELKDFKSPTDKESGNFCASHEILLVFSNWTLIVLVFPCSISMDSGAVDFMDICGKEMIVREKFPPSINP